MIPKRLQTRLKKIEGTPLQDRAKAKSFSRRDVNYIPQDDLLDNEKYDTFFEYEDELAEMKSSSDQYSEMVNNSPFIVLEDIDSDFETPIPSPIVMEQIIPENSVQQKDADIHRKPFGALIFKQCVFIKDDEVRCKRQAPKDSTLCSAHRKFIKLRTQS